MKEAELVTYVLDFAVYSSNLCGLERARDTGPRTGVIQLRVEDAEGLLTLPLKLEQFGPFSCKGKLPGKR